MGADIGSYFLFHQITIKKTDALNVLKISSFGIITLVLKSTFGFQKALVSNQKKVLPHQLQKKLKSKEFFQLIHATQSLFCKRCKTLYSDKFLATKSLTERTMQSSMVKKNTKMLSHSTLFGFRYKKSNKKFPISKPTNEITFRKLHLSS